MLKYNADQGRRKSKSQKLQKSSQKSRKRKSKFQNAVPHTIPLGMWFCKPCNMLLPLHKFKALHAGRNLRYREHSNHSHQSFILVFHLRCAHIMYCFAGTSATLTSSVKVLSRPSTQRLLGQPEIAVWQASLLVQPVRR